MGSLYLYEYTVVTVAPGLKLIRPILITFSQIYAIKVPTGIKCSKKKHRNYISAWYTAQVVAAWTPLSRCSTGASTKLKNSWRCRLTRLQKRWRTLKYYNCGGYNTET